MDIIKGTGPKISIRLNTSQCEVLVPQDLTGKTISVKYKDADGTLIEKSGAAITIISAVLGHFNLTLDAVDTEALAIGNLDLDVYVVDSGDPLIWLIRDQLTVIDRQRDDV